MSRVVATQMVKLLELLSKEGVLVDGNVVYANTTKQLFWKRIAVHLNAVEGGVYKNCWKWCKMWADWKAKSKRKADILLKGKPTRTGEPLPAKLTSLELRLLKLINYPIEEKSNELQIEMVESKEEALNDEMENSDEDNNDDIQSDSRQSFDEDVDTKPSNKIETRFCRVEIPYEEQLKAYDESSDTEKKEWPRRKTQHKYKSKPAPACEKEKAHLRIEEARLKALELKLKGEELRLKEMEMNKINYLTNVEEEKLKCLREISSSLKELVERSRHGNLRFSNVL